MTRRANARFTIRSWDESAWNEGQGLPRLTSDVGHGTEHPFVLDYDLD